MRELIFAAEENQHVLMECASGNVLGEDDTREHRMLALEKRQLDFIGHSHGSVKSPNLCFAGCIVSPPVIPSNKE